MNRSIFIGIIVMVLSTNSFALGLAVDNYEKESHEITQFGGQVTSYETGNRFEFSLFNGAKIKSERRHGLIGNFLRDLISFNFFPFNLFR